MAQFTNVNSKQHILTVCISNTQKMKNCNTNNRKVNIHTHIQQKNYTRLCPVVSNDIK